MVSPIMDPFGAFGGGGLFGGGLLGGGGLFGGSGLFGPPMASSSLTTVGGMDPFSFGGGMGGMGGGAGGMSFSSTSFFGGPGGAAMGSMSGTSMSTRFVNGRKVTTKRTFNNGVETVKEYDNDVLVSHTVNGKPQSVAARSAAIEPGGSNGGRSSGGGRGSPYHRASRH